MIYLVNTNTIANELNNASSIAMKQTQEKMKEKVSAKLDRKEIDPFDGLTYEKYYEKCFYEAVKNKDIYKISTEASSSTGVIHTLIKVPQYKLIPEKELLNIVNVEGEDLDDIDSHYFYEETIKEKNVIETRKWDDLLPKTLYTWKFDEETTIPGYRIEIYAINYATGNAKTKIGPYIELRCTDADDKTTLIDSGEAGALKSTVLSSNKECSCKIVDVVLPKGVTLGDYYVKTDTLVSPKTTYIYTLKTELKEKEGYELSKECDIYHRYINDINVLKPSSIWMQDKNYNKVLKEYLNKLNEKTN